MKGRPETEHDPAHSTRHPEKKEIRAKKTPSKAKATRAAAKAHRKAPQR